MKKILLPLLALSFLVPLQAQQVRSKPLDITLADIPSDQVIPMFGKPTQIDSNGIDGSLLIEYPHATFIYVETYDPDHPDAGFEYVWDGFDTDSPDFCFFSDLFPGGVRVGDRIERVRKLDFVHSRPGKGRERNALRKVDWGNTGTDVFQVLGEEYNSFALEVKDSVVCRIHWVTPIDWSWTAGGILWRIEGDSLPAPSYILGTFPHVPADFCRRIPGLEQAWRSVRAVYREDPDLGPWGGTIPDSMYLPDGKELSSLYEWDEYVDIQDYVKKVTGFRPEELWWTPNGLIRHLRNRYLEQALPGDGKDDMAAHLYKKALSEGKEVHTLPPVFPDIDNWEKRDKRAHDWSLLRLVWYPEGEPDQVKSRIRSQYETYLTQDLDEIGYRLVRDASPIEAGTGVVWLGDWAEELEQAIRREPTLIVVDVSRIVTWDGLTSMIDHRGTYRFHPVTPPKDN